MADRLCDDGHEVDFIGTRRGPEARLASEAGLTFHAVPARGFDRSRPLSFVVAVAVLALSTARAWVLLGRLKADVAVGFGGYVSLPVGFAAIARRLPLVLHEQNSVPGMANRVLSRRATVVGVTYEASVARMRAGTTSVHTGNPVRTAVLAADRVSGRQRLGLPAEAKVLLVFGGSRGARRINEALVDAAPRLMTREDLHVIHIAGIAEVDSVRHALARRDLGADGQDRYRLLDYLQDMASALAAADVVVARAGATSIAEITAVGRAAVLVPYPYATEDHQTLNARDVESAGGAIVVSDAAFDGDSLSSALTTVLDDPEARRRMAEASASLGVRDAAQRLCALIEGAASGRLTGEVVA